MIACPRLNSHLNFNRRDANNLRRGRSCLCREKKEGKWKGRGSQGNWPSRSSRLTGGEDARGPHLPRNGQADWSVGFWLVGACQAILSDLSQSEAICWAIKVLILCRCLSSPSLSFPWLSTYSATLGVQHDKTIYDTPQRSETC